jgi:hypothetical protein
VSEGRRDGGWKYFKMNRGAGVSDGELVRQ